MTSSRKQRRESGGDRPKIIAPYERVSALMKREQNDEAFRSPDIQRRENLRRIEQYPNAVIFPDAIEHPEKYRDIDKTGRDFHRDGIQRLIDLKKRGVIDGIAVLDISRIGRNAPETLRVMETFQENGGVVLSAKETFDDTDEGRLITGMFALFAQLYSDRIATGWRAVVEARANDGLLNGTPPVGYVLETDEAGKKQVVVDPIKATAVVEAFHRYAAGGTATSIENGLRERGVLAARLKRMLSNPFYIGKLRLHDYEGQAKKRIRTGTDRIYPGRHVALLVDENGEPDVELFERVRDRLRRESKLPKRYVEPIHSLGGLIKCAYCGRSLTHNLAALPYFSCRNGVNRIGCGGCSTARVEHVEAAVRQEIRNRWKAFEIGDADVATTIEKKSAALADRKKIEREIERVNEKITRADDAFFSNRLPQDRYDRLVENAERELAQLRSALDETEPVVDGPDVETFIAAAKRLDEEWDSSTPAQRNALLRAAAVTKVEVERSGYYRQPATERLTVTLSI